MPWRNSVSAGERERITDAQRRMINSLHEQIDGVAMGTYADDPLKVHFQAEATREIERLQAILKKKKPRYPCAVCFEYGAHAPNCLMLKANGK